jgi:two-component system, NarL family, nitrate/nitrite response regulator NarL
VEGTAQAGSRITCVVADDHPVVLDAVVEYLERAGIQVVARARDGNEALEAIRTHRPQVALVDVGMPRMGGMEVAREASRTMQETGVILYTGMAEREILTEALDAGARAFLLKEAPMQDLVRAIETVAAGGVYVDSVLAGVIASAEGARTSPRLTLREREVLRLLADGLRNEEIGKRLFISPETVRTHVRKAMNKLEADTRTQAVAEAIRQHVIA